MHRLNETLETEKAKNRQLVSGVISIIHFIIVGRNKIFKKKSYKGRKERSKVKEKSNMNLCTREQHIFGSI